MNFIYAILIHAAFNLLNSRLDAYLILKQKKIAHGVNFGMYAVTVGLTIWLFHFDIAHGILIGAGALFNRQLTFDIPLNLRRGLSYDYVTPADPPAALFDRLEIRIFGRNGKKMVIWYLGIFITLTTISLL